MRLRAAIASALIVLDGPKSALIGMESGQKADGEIWLELMTWDGLMW
jgi:hypothetical protein